MGNGNVKESGNMDAESVEKLLKGLPNFGGIYKLDQLKYMKIISLPVSLIILAQQHWISIYISSKLIEVMDSLGFIGSANLHKSLRRFLRVHLCGKDLSITPRLQSLDSISSPRTH